MKTADIYLKKQISYDFRGVELQFKVSQELFSSQQVDFGTQRLLRTMATQGVNTYSKVLDLGCGYGPIGIALKKYYPDCSVHMTDRDALALEYTKENAALNKVDKVQTYGSLGFDGVIDTDFDMILSNIPAKVGEKALSHFLQDTQYYLQPHGRVIVVVIDAIAEYVGSVLTQDESIHILFQKGWPGHVVFHYEFVHPNQKVKKPEESAFQRGIFDREAVIWQYNGQDYQIKTTYGMSEFDTLSFQSSLLIDRFRTINNQHIKSAVIFNVSQGYIPLAFSTTTLPQHLFLVDRNLQALTVTERNLILNGISKKHFSTHFQVGIASKDFQKVDYIAGVLPDDEGILAHQMYLRQAAELLVPKGTLLIASSSTNITRAEEFSHAEKLFDVVERKRSKGNSTLILKRKV